jgi:hypothetical protein
LLLQIDLCRSAGQALYVDRLRGAAILSQGAVLALKAGDPARAACAIAGEAAAMAHHGPRARDKVRDLLERARAISKGAAMDSLLELRLLEAEAGAALLYGDFDGAVVKHREVMRLARETPGAQWDLGNAAIIGCAALYATGRTAGFGQYATAALDEALALGHRYTATMLRAHVAFGHLLSDNPDGAARELAQIAREAPKEGLHGEHVGMFTGQIALHLYRGDPNSALSHIREVWPALSRSLLLRVAYVRMDCTSWCARATLAALAQRPRDPRLRLEARLRIRALTKSDFPEARSAARLLRASLLRIEGQLSSSTSMLDGVEASLELLDRPVLAALTALRNPQALRRQRAEHYLREQGVASPLSLARMYAPWLDV